MPTTITPATRRSRGALEAWERKLLAIITGKKVGKVISITRKRRKIV